jgi:hypothetical protein
MRVMTCGLTVDRTCVHACRPDTDHQATGGGSGVAHDLGILAAVAVFVLAAGSMIKMWVTDRDRDVRAAALADFEERAEQQRREALTPKQRAKEDEEERQYWLALEKAAAEQRAKEDEKERQYWLAREKSAADTRNKQGGG